MKELRVWASCDITDWKEDVIRVKRDQTTKTYCQNNFRNLFENALKTSANKIKPMIILEVFCLFVLHIVHWHRKDTFWSPSLFFHSAGTVIWGNILISKLNEEALLNGNFQLTFTHIKKDNRQLLLSHLLPVHYPEATTLLKKHPVVK